MPSLNLRTEGPELTDRIAVLLTEFRDALDGSMPLANMEDEAIELRGLVYRLEVITTAVTAVPLLGG